ncbi:MAG: leucine-rich repeat domain-containing protein [Ruminococcus sp.]|nr:leucine-rich repeat domain-containing protein [Ruminococcus sp.]
MDFEIKNGVLEHYNGNTPDVIIPSNVKEIGEKAFKDNKFLKSVIITRNVTVIGESAFEDCKNLEKIEIPKSVTKIGEFAFLQCDSLRKIVIPESVTTIDDFAFDSCYNLNEIVIPKSVTTIGDGAFDVTKWLENKMATEKNVVIVNDIVISRANNIEESVNLEGVKEILTGVFLNCNEIKEFIVSDGTKIGYNAFFTGNTFNICLKHDDFSVNIPVKESEMEDYFFNTRTQNLFDFIGAGIEQKEYLFDELEIPAYRYPLALFMANVYESKFFRTFVDVHFKKIQKYAKNKAPYLLEFISR